MSVLMELKREHQESQVPDVPNAQHTQIVKDVTNAQTQACPTLIKKEERTIKSEAQIQKKKLDSDIALLGKRKRCHKQEHDQLQRIYTAKYRKVRKETENDSVAQDAAFTKLMSEFEREKRGIDERSIAKSEPVKLEQETEGQREQDSRTNIAVVPRIVSTF
jgi:hypothetical protein